MAIETGRETTAAGYISNETYVTDIINCKSSIVALCNSNIKQS